MLDEIAPSWADVSASFSVLGGKILETIDFSALSSGDSVEVGEKRGASGGRIMATTTGAVTPKAAATFYMSGFRKLIAALADRAPRRGDRYLISLVRFDVVQLWTPPGEILIYKKEILGCRLLGRDAKTAEGSEADLVELSINPMEIVDYDEQGRKIVLL